MAAIWIPYLRSWEQKILPDGRGRIGPRPAVPPIPFFGWLYPSRNLQKDCSGMHKPALSTVFIGATAMVVVSLATLFAIGLAEHWSLNITTREVAPQI